MGSSIELDGGVLAMNTWIDESENSRDGLCDQVEDFNCPSEASGVRIESVQAEHCPYIKSRALVSSLPNEILSTIFEAGHLSSPFGPLKQPFESLISQVTMRWRRTALATPQLWTRLYINFGRSSHSMTEAYLSRSGALPLDLHLTTGDASISEFDEIVHFSLIRRHANRWRRLRVDPSWRNVLNQLLDILPSTVPLLECVQICSEEVDQKDILARGIFKGGAPSLTSVGIRGIELQCCLPPLATVTSLQLHSAALSQTLASVLNGLPALTFLVIDGAFSRWEHLRTTISLPALEEFRLITWSVGEMPDLLKMISAPLLNSLLLENVVPSDIDDFLGSVGWTPGWVKYPRLRFLTVLTSEGSSFEPLSWTNIVRAFPTVTHVTIVTDHLDDFLAILHPSAFTILWPELHTLTLINYSPTHPTPALLRDTLSARIASGYSLLQLRVSSSIMTALSDDLEWLGAQMDLAETTLYADLSKNLYFIRWPDDGS